MRYWKYSVRGTGVCVNLCAIMLLLAVMAIPPLLGQRSTGRITGNVKDPSGSMVVGAKIEILNADTGYRTETVTAMDGGYVFPNVPRGTYTVSVSSAGFQSQSHAGVLVTIDASIEVNFSLKIGSVKEMVTVSGQPPLVDTTSSDISEVINERTITELPLNGRNPASLVFLTPGIGPQVGGGIQGLTTHPGSTLASSNGGRQGSTSYQLDGTTNMDPYMGSASPFPNPEATQEFRVSNLNYSAEFGFAPGAVVNVATRSGTNQFHGALFEFHRQRAFNARNFFAAEPDGLRRNQYGGSIGGPILKDKLFFFFNMQRTADFTQSAARKTGGRVPTPAMLKGDFSAISTPLRDPVTGDLLPNNQMPLSRISQTAIRFMKAVGIQPETSNPQGFITVPGAQRRPVDTQITGKMDFNLNEKNVFMARFFRDNYDRPGFESPIVFAIGSSWEALSKNYAFRYTYTPTASFVNQFTVTLKDTPTSSLAPFPLVSWKDDVGVDFAQHPSFRKAIFNFWGPFGWDAGDNIFNRNMMSYADSVYWVKGRHSIKFGGSYRHHNWRMANNYVSNGTMWYSGDYTGDTLSDFVVGRPKVDVQNGGVDVMYHQNEFAAFIEDSYRIKPNLTVNAGLRFEPYLPATTLKMHAFRPGQQSTTFPNAPTGLVFAKDAGIGEAGTRKYINNWMPRLGLVWAPAALPNTSIRAAVGLFSAPVIFSNYNSIGTEAPFSSHYVIFDPPDMAHPWANVPGGNPFPGDFSFPDKLPPSDATFAQNLNIVPSFPADFQPPRMVTWNLSVEHQFGNQLFARASYVGTQTSHFAYATDINPAYWSPELDGLPTNERRLRYPGYGFIQQFQAGANASYNALQTTVERRFSHGLTFSANYTFSKSLDNYSTASFMRVVGNPFDLGWNRGPADQDKTHMFSASWVWELPVPRFENTVASYLLNGWQLSGLLTAYSGSPVTILSGVDRSGSGNHIDRADMVAGQTPTLPTGRSRGELISEYFNTAAFSVNQKGTFGTAPRGLLRGPGSKDVDLALAKNFTFSERYRLQLRWEAFNAFNFVNLGSPLTNRSSGGFGRIFSAGAPRIMQIAVRFNF